MTYDAEILADDPTSYWPLTEASGSTAADLQSVYNGTINGGVTLGQIGPTVDRRTAFTFNGSTGYISIGSNVPLLGTPQFSIEAWFKTTNGTGEMAIYRWRFNGHGLRLVNGLADCQFYNSVGTQQRVTSRSKYNDGLWHHIVATYNGVTLLLYVDGILVGSTATTAVPHYPAGDLVAIGKDGGGSVFWWNGSLARVAVYDHALTPARIEAHYTTWVKYQTGWMFRPAFPAANSMWRWGAAEINGLIYLAGGTTNNSTPSTNFVAYDPLTGTLTSKAVLPEARWDHAVAALGDKVYVVGGTNSGGSAVATLYEYNTATNAWTTRTSMPGTKRQHGAAVVGGKLYAISGSTTATYEWNPATNTWATKTVIATARAFPGVCAHTDGKIYVLGGSSVSSDHRYFDPVANSWTTRTSPASGRQGHAYVAFAGRLWAFGGLTASSYRKADAYDPTTNTWTAKEDLAADHYQLAGVVVAQAGLYALGGADPGAGSVGTGQVERYQVPSIDGEATMTGSGRLIEGTIGQLSGLAGTGTLSAEGEVDYLNRSIGFLPLKARVEVERPLLISSELGDIVDVDAVTITSMSSAQIDSGRILIVYDREVATVFTGADWETVARVCEVNGNTVTVGPAVVVNGVHDRDSVPGIAKLTATTFACVWISDGDVDAGTLQGKVLTVDSGTGITVPGTIETMTVTDAGHYNWTEKYTRRVLPIDSTRVLVAYLQGSASGPWPAKAVVVSVSGTSLTAGTPIDLGGLDYYSKGDIEIVELEAEKFLVGWAKYVTPNYEATVRVLTVSGATLSAGPETVVVSTPQYYEPIHLRKITNTKAVVTYWDEPSPDVFNTMLSVLDISGTAITASSPVGVDEGRDLENADIAYMQDVGGLSIFVVSGVEFSSVMDLDGEAAPVYVVGLAADGSVSILDEHLLDISNTLWDFLVEPVSPTQAVVWWQDDFPMAAVITLDAELWMP